MKHEYEYKNDVKRLDELVKKVLSGVTPMVDEFTMHEVEIRMHEIYEKTGLDDTDTDGIDIEEMIAETELMKAAVEEQQRKASKKDIIRLTLSNEVKQQIADDMSVAYVRTRVSSYNEETTELDAGNELKLIKRKLSKLRRGYFHVDDWKHAVDIVFEALEYARKNAYPWMRPEEFDERLKDGSISFNVRLPVLYKDYNTEIHDPEILKGIYTGTINVIEEEKDDDEFFFDRSTIEWGNEDYFIISPAEGKYYKDLASQGYDVPTSAMMKGGLNNLYERFVPSSRREIKPTQIRDFFTYQKKMKIGTGGKKVPYSPQEIMNKVVESNKNMNTSISTNIGKVLLQLSQPADAKVISTNYSSGEIITNPESKKKEAAIMSAIKKTNPGTNG